MQELTGWLELVVFERKFVFLGPKLLEFQIAPCFVTERCPKFVCNHARRAPYFLYLSFKIYLCKEGRKDIVCSILEQIDTGSGLLCWGKLLPNGIYTEFFIQ